MAISRDKKNTLVAELAELFADAKCAVDLGSRGEGAGIDVGHGRRAPLRGGVWAAL